MACKYVFKMLRKGAVVDESLKANIRWHHLFACGMRLRETEVGFFFWSTGENILYVSTPMLVSAFLCKGQ